MNESQNTLFTAAGVSMITIGVSVALYHAQKRRHHVVWAIGRHWSQLVKGLLSLSISRSEQSIFEEEFKYLIVTSSLFNEQPLADNNKVIQPNMEPVVDVPSSLFNRLVTITLLNVMMIIFIMTTNRSVSPYIIPCLLPAYITTCYFIYRHHRHVQVRRIHASALNSMHKIISLSQKSDSLLFRLLNALPTEPQQQQAFGTLLSNHFEAYIECVHQLQPLIDTHNLATFRDMYNLNETIPSLLLEFDSHQYGVEDIHLIYSVICWKRREYLLYLLSLDVMSNHNRTHYGKTWRQAIQVNHGLVHAYLQFNEKLESMASLVDARVQKEEVLSVQTSPSSMTAATAGAGAEGLLSSSSHHSDSRSITLMHRVSALEKHVEDIQAKLFLCKQDTKSLSSGRVSWLGLERMNKRFSQIDEHMQIMIGQWEESKHALEEMLEDQQTKLDTIASLPSPPSSPRGLPTLEDKRSYQPFTVKRMHSFNNSKYKTRTETI